MENLKELMKKFKNKNLLDVEAFLPIDSPKTASDD